MDQDQWDNYNQTTPTTEHKDPDQTSKNTCHHPTKTQTPNPSPCITVNTAVSLYGIDFNVVVPFFKEHMHWVKYVTQIKKGKQNHNFKLTTNTGKDYMCRVPGIDNLHHHGQESDIVFKNSELASHVYKVAPLVCAYDSPHEVPHPTSVILKGREGTGIIITEYIRQRSLTVQDFVDNDRLMEQVVSVVCKYHKLSLKPIDTNTEQGRDNNLLLPSACSNVLWYYELEEISNGWKSFTPTVFQQAQLLQTLLDHAREMFGPLVSCHNDLCPSNMLCVEDRVLLVDWEFSGVGDRLYDLATLVEHTNQDDKGEEQVLQMYFKRPPSELEAARLSIWRVWYAMRRALRARQTMVSATSTGTKSNEHNNAYVQGRNYSFPAYVDGCTEQSEAWLQRFTLLLGRESVQGTEYDTGHLEILQNAVNTILADQEKARKDKEFQERKQARQLEKERLLAQGEGDDY